MASSNAFLGGAKGRLLPAALVFRYFASALVFLALAWIALFVAAPALPRFAGGLGWPLAALHLVTLGVLVMTAIVTSLQLLPVASRQALAPSHWPYDLVWGLLVIGVIALTSGMAWLLPTLLLAGALALTLALLLYFYLLAQNLRGARGMPLVIVHGWAVGVSLLLLVASGLSLAAAYSAVPLLDRQTALSLHIIFGGYGFMGMLVMGFSYILVPMFALSDNPAPRWANLSVTLAIVSLALLLLTSVGVLPPRLLTLAISVGAVAFAIHVALMQRSLRNGMRKGLGKSVILVRLGWSALLASFAVALAFALGAEATSPHGPAVLGLLLFGGLLTLLLGVLSRIVPFLASMHAGSGQRRPPTPSGLTAQRPLDVHFYSHIAALLTLLLALFADSVWLVRASALLGLAGALAFGVFFVTAWRRMTA